MNRGSSFEKQAYFSTFAFFERTATAISVDHTGKDLPTVFAPYHVNHDIISPAVLGLYLMQRACGFLRKQFKAVICHKLADVFDTGQVIYRCVKFLPYLNVMAVVTHVSSLLMKTFATIVFKFFRIEISIKS